MTNFAYSFRRCAAWRASVPGFCLLLLGTLAFAPAAHAQATTQPTPAPVAAPDPIGFNGGPTEPLLNPNSYLTGWATGSADKNLDATTGGTFKPWTGDKP